MTATSGRRERKKEATRRAILDAARRLFAERGFEAVKIADVAEAADVAPQTVFNHFDCKEDLFFGRYEDFVVGPSQAVATRADGESIINAVRRHVLATWSAPTCEMSSDWPGWMRTLDGCPALRAREGQLAQHCEELLAAALGAELGAAERAGPLPRLVASLLVAGKRAIMDEVRRRVVAGESADEVAAGVRMLVGKVFDYLEHGLGNIGIRPRRDGISLAVSPPLLTENSRVTTVGSGTLSSHGQ